MGGPERFGATFDFTLVIGKVTIVDDLLFLLGRALRSIWLSDATRRLVVDASSDDDDGMDDLLSGDDIGDMIRDGMSGRGATGEDIWVGFFRRCM
jgi:hypothetical protein